MGADSIPRTWNGFPPLIPTTGPGRQIQSLSPQPGAGPQEEALLSRLGRESLLCSPELATSCGEGANTPAVDTPTPGHLRVVTFSVPISRHYFGVSAVPTHVLMTVGDSPNHAALLFKNICLKVTSCVTHVAAARACTAVVVVGVKSEFQVNSFGDTLCHRYYFVFSFGNS